MSFATDIKTTAPAMVAASRILGVLALSLAGAGLAQADQHLTREQVKAQVVEAERTGDIFEPWTKMKLNELYPSEYPTKPADLRNVAPLGTVDHKVQLYAGQSPWITGAN